MEDDDWMDATAYGSDFEQQVSRKGRWRHRPLRLTTDDSLHFGARRKMRFVGCGEWVSGPVPDLFTEQK